MEENKFEKQVQQKMGELEIQPSDTVWKKIELQLQKKKSRRWGLIILFLLSGLILSGGYWLWNTRQQILSDYNNSLKSSSEKNINQTSAKENKIVKQQIKSVPESVNQKNNEVGTDGEKENKKYYKLLTGSKASQKTNSEEKNSTTFYKEKKIIGDLSGDNNAEIISAQSAQEKPENNNIDKKLEDSIHKTNNDSLSNQATQNIVPKDNNTPKQTPNIAETVKRSNKNKWKFGILFSGGISGAGNNFLGLNNSISEDFSNSVTPGQTNPGQTLQILPPLVKSGFGFVTGVFAEKNISEKTKFSLGLNFKSFNTSVKLYDSAGIYRAAVYSLSQGVNKYIRYVNHFNFIEVPVSIKIQIGKGKNIPLVWQGGFAVAELISSNALQINPNTGYYYYYHDNSIFNKTQIGFNTGFFASLFSKQKTSILIGPYFYYDASKIAHEGLYSKKHFVFAGLHTEIIFDK